MRASVNKPLHRPCRGWIAEKVDCKAGLTSVKLIEHLGFCRETGGQSVLAALLATPRAVPRNAKTVRNEGEAGLTKGRRGRSKAAKMDFPMKLSRTVSYAVRATLQLAQL